MVFCCLACRSLLINLIVNTAAITIHLKNTNTHHIIFSTYMKLD